MIAKIIPLIITFWLGYLLKKIKVFDNLAAGIFLKAVFYVTLPANIILSVQSVVWDKNFLFLPLVSITIIFITYFFVMFFFKNYNIPNSTKGAFILSALIINTGFTLPFMMAVFGDKSVLIYTFYDFGNQLLIYTFIYFIAMKYGDKTRGKVKWSKFFKIPPLWALIFGLSIKFLNISFTDFLKNTFLLLGTSTKFLIMFSLGIYFSFAFKRGKLILFSILLRSILGLMFSVILVKIFNILGILRIFTIIFSAAPVGYNTLVLSSLENLDMDYAAEVVSVSIFLGLIYIPIMILVLR